MSEESYDDGESNAPVVADEGDRQPPEVAEAEETIASLAGEICHGVEIDPEVVADIDFVASDTVASSRRYSIPALVAMINYRVEHDPMFVQPVGWDEIKSMVTGELGMSKTTAENYREDMVDAGAIHPHPSEDDRIEDVYDEALCKAAGVDHPDDVADGAEEFYPDTTRGFVAWALQQQEWDVGGIYVDGDAWAHDTWMIIREAVWGILTTEPSDDRVRESMTRQERIDGASSVVIELARLLSDVVEGVDAGDIIRSVVRAASIDGTDTDELEQWRRMWAETVADTEATIYGSESDVVDVDVDEAVGVLEGVDADSTDEEIRAARREYILDNHPDQSDNDGLSDEYQMVQALGGVLGD